MATGIYIYYLPFQTVNELRIALKSADKQKLQELIDFPMLRENLKTDLGEQINQSAVSPVFHGSMGSIAVFMRSMILNSIVDSLVKPENLELLLSGQRPTAYSSGKTEGGLPEDHGRTPQSENLEQKGENIEANSTSSRKVITHSYYKDFDTFCVDVTNPQYQEKFVFKGTLQRQDLFHWKLSRIRVVLKDIEK
jgi:hypothetical protein